MRYSAPSETNSFRKLASVLATHGYVPGDYFEAYGITQVDVNNFTDRYQIQLRRELVAEISDFGYRAYSVDGKALSIATVESLIKKKDGVKI